MVSGVSCSPCTSVLVLPILEFVYLLQIVAGNLLNVLYKIEIAPKFLWPRNGKQSVLQRQLVSGVQENH